MAGAGRRTGRWLGLMACVCVVAAWAGCRSIASMNERGTISFQFVPHQDGSPVAVDAVTLDSDAPWQPIWELRNTSARGVTAVTAAVLIGTRWSTRMRTGPATPLRLPPGGSAEMIVGLPRLWDREPWAAFKRGAVFTLGLAGFEFDDGSRWTSDAIHREEFQAGPDVRYQHRQLIRPIPEWRVSPVRSLRFKAAIAEYGSNSSLEERSCRMEICGTERACEFDGCAIRP